MTLNLQLSTTSSNLYQYLRGWEDDFPTNDNGAFNGIFGGGDQWWAGDPTQTPGTPNDSPSVIMDIDDYSYAPGQFNGDVPKLALGSHLVHDISNDIFTQTDELVITQQGGGYMPITATFREAIYSLSHGGAVDGDTYTFQIPGQPPVTQDFRGLTDYFAEQGTNQVGTAGNDILLSFAGDDTLTGAGGIDVFQWHIDYYETNGVVSDANGLVLGWGDDAITDFVDGTERILFTGFGWSDYNDFVNDGGSISGNVITYADATLGITSTITVNFDGTGTLGSEDIIFIA